MTHRAVAIDGPAASGKSTVANILAEKLDLLMVNSGAMYRAVTWLVLQKNADPTDPQAVESTLAHANLQCGTKNRRSTISVNGKLLTSELRAPEVNAAVSAVASVPAVRARLVDLQRDFLKTHDLIMEGRDIGSVVFPETPFKLYISASEEVRSARRAAEGETDTIATRDKQDSARKISPLIVPEGAILIDSSNLTLPQTVEAAHQALLSLGWDQKTK